jgi:hypothetical protein
VHDLTNYYNPERESKDPALSTSSFSEVELGNKIKTSKLADLQEEWLNKLGKYSWITNLYQLFIGIATAVVAVWWSKPYLHGWVIGIAVFIFLSGAFYGWFITRKLEIRLTEKRAAIFSYTGLMKQFLPMLIILFTLRWTLRYLGSRGITNAAPMMRTLTFFIAGVFLARAITILVLIYLLYKNNPVETL